MTAARLARRPPGRVAWLAVVGGTAAWLAHISALAAIAPLACRRPGAEWVMHGLTLVLGAAAAAGLAWCLPLARGGGDDGDPGRRRSTAFLARVGALVAVTNVVLIAAEGAYVLVFDPCR